MAAAPYGLTDEEYRLLASLDTPERIQDYLDTLAINFEKQGETCRSPRRVLQTKKAHCMEGALLAYAALLIHKQKPLLLDLKSARGDDDHVIVLCRKDGRYGAISKTNHATLRFRDPVYQSVRELVMSYFHEYFLNKNGKKTLMSYSAPFSLAGFGTDWITAERDLWEIPKALDKSPHFPIASKETLARTRPADPIERAAGRLTEWKRTDRGT
ncbi:MAG TPA: hypothetical protein VEA36_01230 [Candidatus Paceibacterota bacterium]|nr:hypothetical protein [Candidatus Paceibacterota bacterium]